MTENTAMQWTDASHTLVNDHWGRAPGLIEVIQARIDLPYAVAHTRAWQLNETGQRLAEIPVKIMRARRVAVDPGKGQLVI